MFHKTDLNLAGCRIYVLKTAFNQLKRRDREHVSSDRRDSEQTRVFLGLPLSKTFLLIAEFPENDCNLKKALLKPYPCVTQTQTLLPESDDREGITQALLMPYSSLTQTLIVS